MFDLTYNGKTFNQRESDNYVNVGQMCANSDKRLQNWTATASAKDYLTAVESSTGITALDLLVVKMGNEGTWAHPLVAIEVARWIDPNFGVWCNIHIRQLIETGRTSISKIDLARMVIESEEARMKSDRRAATFQAQIEADEPATTLGKAIAKAPNNIRIGDFAKSIDMGQNRYFDELRADGIIQQTSTLPYQQFLNAKYFVVTQIISGNGKTYPVALITPKCQVYLAKRHSKFISQEAIRDAIECQVVALV